METALKRNTDAAATFSQVMADDGDSFTISFIFEELSTVVLSASSCKGAMVVPNVTIVRWSLGSVACDFVDNYILDTLLVVRAYYNDALLE